MSNKVENNNTVSVHYVGTLNDGTVFDSSRARETTLTFVTGIGQVVPGFDNAVMGMTVGEVKTVKLSVEEGYGARNPNAFTLAPKTAFPEDFVFEKGAVVSGQQNGQQFQAIVEGATDNHVVLDVNHPLAGQELTFEIEVLTITPNVE